MSSEGVRKRPMQQEKPAGAAEQKSGGLTSLLPSKDSRWRNWWIRGVFTFVMVGGFCVVIYLGPFYLSLLVIAVLVKCFQEIITIGYSKYKEYNLPLYRVLNWYFLMVATYFLFGDNIFFYYPEYRTLGSLLSPLAQYHRILSFSLYILGFVMFVLTLKKDHYQTQFGMFGWTHLTLFVLGSQAYFITQNIFEGLFWCLLPVSMVICNDIAAYLFGFFFGRTRLIKLSPKKTWEGFLGAFASTVIFGFILAYFLCKFDYFVCYHAQSHCDRPPIFTQQEYSLGAVSLYLYPAQLHSFPLSIFASLIAPFGGFFASGFKRAFNVKDFDDVIPGHGGLMDRFDCQILMTTFANVYYFTFCRALNPDKLVSLLLALPADKQVDILKQLQSKLSDEGHLSG